MQTARCHFSDAVRSALLLALLALVAFAGPVASAGEGEQDAPAAEAGGEDLEGRLLEEIRRLTVEEGERRAQAQELVNAAEKRKNLAEYDAARRLLEKALQLDPRNEVARERLREVQALLPSAPEERGTLIQDQVRKEHIRVDAEKAEIGNLLSSVERKTAEAVKRTEGEPTPDEVEAALALLRAARSDLDRAHLKLRSLSGRVGMGEERAQATQLEKRLTDLTAATMAKEGELARMSAMEQIEEKKAIVEAYRAEQRDRLLAQAEEHTRMQQYEEAEGIIEQLLRDHPNDQEVIDLRQKMDRERLGNRRAEVHNREVWERKKLLQYIEEAATPEYGRLVYPDNWWELVERRESDGTFQTEGDIPDWKVEILQKMEEPVSFEFQEAPLQEVIQFLAGYTGINMVLADTIAGGGGEEGGGGEFGGGGFGGGGGRTITLRLQDVRLENALRWVMTITNLDYVIRDEAVYIDEPQNLDTEYQPRIYDVSDLVNEVGDSPMPSHTGDDDDDDDDDAEEIGLVEVLNKIRPETWDDPRASINMVNSSNLVVRQTEDVHELVRQALSELRAAQAIQVTVTSRFLSVRDEMWEEMNSQFGDFANTLTYAASKVYTNDAGEVIREMNKSRGSPGDGNSRYRGMQHDEYGAWRGDHGQHHTDVRGTFTNNAWNTLLSVLGANLGTTAPGSTGAGLTGQVYQWGWLGQLQMNWFLRMLRESTLADELWAPHLLVYNNRRAYITSADEFPYINDYSIGAGGGYQANREVLEQGVTLLVRPTVSADKRYISLDIRTRTDKLLSMDQTVMRITGMTDEGIPTLIAAMPIDLPSALVQDTRTYATIPDGGSILLSGLSINVNNRGKSGIPVASDLPVVGKLFSSRINQKEKRSLMILVNARMLLLNEEEAKLAR